MDSKRPQLLFVLTSHDKIGDTGKKTGWYLVSMDSSPFKSHRRIGIQSEFAHPYHVLSPHTDITVASPAGGKAPLDPNSVQDCKDDLESMSFLEKNEHIWNNTEKISDLVDKANKFDAVFFVGGFGPLYDLPTLPASHSLLRALHASSRIIAAVCHGPAAIAKVKLDDGTFLIANSAVTGITNAEEVVFGFENDMPFSLEDALDANSGGGFRKAEERLGPCVVVAQEGRLMTGQNPASARPLAEALLERLMGK